jgi:hypothetical protein
MTIYNKFGNAIPFGCSGHSQVNFLNLTARYLRHLILVIFCHLLLPTFSHAEAGRGNVDLAQYDKNSGVMLLSGWAAPDLPTVYTSYIVISVGDQQIYRGRFKRSERPDVVTVTQRADWLWSGWSVEVNAPNLRPGSHDIRVRVVLTDGDAFDLDTYGKTKSIEIPGKNTPTIKHLLLLAFSIILPALTLLFPSTFNRLIKKRLTPAALFFSSVVLSFLLLVASGFTGSSVRLAIKDSPLLTHDAVEWKGQARSIRSDEWNILTQLAIGQANTLPKFPVVNHNIGIDGNNMLIVGMTGVPVSHISSLAKPATWGFWSLNLRNALAWHWWFPFFACFLALWAVLIRFFKLDWRIASVLAITIPASPYSVVFSGHPAYVVFFPTLSLLILDKIFNVKNFSLAVFWGFMLGLALSGFILVLYLPWQISLLYLLIPFGVSHFLARKHELLFGRPQIIAIVMALVVSLGLIGSWLIDTLEVLRTISTTVYPGQRSTSVGGDIDPWYLIKGLLNPVSLYHETPMMSASDAGSFVWLWLPLVVVCGLVFWDERKLDVVPAVIIGFVFLALAYIYIGFPKPLAALTGWGRVTSYRLDISLGLAQLLLFAWLMSKNYVFANLNLLVVSRIALGVGLLSIIWSIWLFGKLPATLTQIFTPGYVLISSTLLGFLSYLLIEKRVVLTIFIYSVWMVGSAYSFNPLDLAPRQVSANSHLSSAIKSQDFENNQVRIAVLDMYTWRMNLVAAALPVVNAILYYPQPTLWEKIDPSGQYKKLYNRYQSLDFTVANLPEQFSYQIDSPQLDAVRLTLDSNRFDFRQLGATHVLTMPKTALELISNDSLQHVASHENWVLFRVAK